jgi:hypothetical protein
MIDYPFINELKDLEQKAYNTGNKIQRQINNAVYDARVSTFYFIAQAIRSIKIYLILKNEYLDDRQWCIDTYLSKYKQEWPVTGGKIMQIINDHNVLTKEFNEIMLVAYSQILFSIVESKFRLFQLAIDPNALTNRSDKFTNVYTCLLSEIKKTIYQDFIIFFCINTQYYS